jgi:hypothetical protein
MLKNRTNMKKYLIVIFLLIPIGCTNRSNKTANVKETTTINYVLFDQENHLQPDFDKTNFDTLHGWDFGWAILEPINIAKSRADDKELSKRFSSGQKALYFFWYLEEEVTNGGFIQFYWNGYREYLPAIETGLKLVGDTNLIELIEKADKEYLANKNKFDLQQELNDWEPLYDNLVQFNDFDQEYYKMRNSTMDKIEKYIRLKPAEFVNLK